MNIFNNYVLFWQTVFCPDINHGWLGVKNQLSVNLSFFFFFCFFSSSLSVLLLLTALIWSFVIDWALSTKGKRSSSFWYPLYPRRQTNKYTTRGRERVAQCRHTCLATPQRERNAGCLHLLCNTSQLGHVGWGVTGPRNGELSPLLTTPTRRSPDN